MARVHIDLAALDNFIKTSNTEAASGQAVDSILQSAWRILYGAGIFLAYDETLDPGGATLAKPEDAPTAPTESGGAAPAPASEPPPGPAPGQGLPHLQLQMNAGRLEAIVDEGEGKSYTVWWAGNDMPPVDGLIQALAFALATIFNSPPTSGPIDWPWPKS